MKNRYEMRGDVTVIWVKHKGKEIGVLIDSTMLLRVTRVPNTWRIKTSGKNWYVVTEHREAGKVRRVRLHRLLMDEPLGLEVDHLNGDGLDNRLANLRAVTKAENARNRGLGADNSSGYLGVSRSESNKWRADIGVKGRKCYLGTFDNRELAALVRDTAAEYYYGEHGRYNFPLLGEAGRDGDIWDGGMALAA